jgi:hypothetical protein
VLADEERAVRADLNSDLGARQRVRLCRGRRRREERRRKEKEDEPLQLENWTDGASRVAPSVSKYSRGRKLKIPATMFVGTVSSALS